jgi:hypothetical protein
MTHSVVVLSKLLNDEASEKDIARLMNHAKNRTKHMYQSNDDVVHFDPRTEAKDILDRAIENYYHLMNRYPLVETEWINRFNQARFSF